MAFKKGSGTEGVGFDVAGLPELGFEKIPVLAGVGTFPTLNAEEAFSFKGLASLFFPSSESPGS